MKVLIAHDMEGISGVVDWRHTESGNPEYERFRRIMTAEVNAAIEGALQAGATDIVVADGHGGGRNVLIEQLNPTARVHCGSPSPLSMVSGVDGGVAVAFFIGYHAASGTREAILAHTWSCSRVLGLWLNGDAAGEIRLNAAVCGHFGVPVLLVTGDQAACAEAAALLPGVTTVAVKRATAFQAAECLNPEVTQPRIREAAAQALRQYRESALPRPLQLAQPVRLAVELGTPAMADIASLIPGMQRVDGRRIEAEYPDPVTAYRAFRVAVSLAGGV
jgi:D-amino peptidase